MEVDEGPVAEWKQAEGKRPDGPVGEPVPGQREADGVEGLELASDEGRGEGGAGGVEVSVVEPVFEMVELREAVGLREVDDGDELPVDG